VLELTTIYNAQNSKVNITIYVVATKTFKKKRGVKFRFHLIWW
jgi:hypothetical protein